ncbi:hypothetical protein [Shinella sp. BYT-45]|uniref:hypothetical protein n=1 Tax=Shinella sp. BYT-45 TaxID=3377377 RepID=UPI00397EC42A
MAIAQSPGNCPIYLNWMDFPVPACICGPDFYRVREKFISAAPFNRFGMRRGLSGLLHMADDV